MITPLNIGIIGMGKVGHYLAHEFRRNGLQVHCFSSSNETYISPEEYVNYTSKIDVCLLCVPDSAIAQISSNLSASNALVAHVSGTTPLQALDTKHSNRGIFYPLMSLTEASDLDIKAIPFCLEANSEESLKRLKQLAETLQVRAQVMNSEQRKKLHLAAVLSQNFSNHLYQMAYEVMAEANLPFDLLKPLLLQAVDRLDNEAPLKFQTGPAVRNDKKTIENHLASLKDSTTREIYELITRSIQENEKEL